MLAMLFASLIISFASADISQQEASGICNPYSLESETITIVGPVSCEGKYWVCEFLYFGNKQNVQVAISKGNGGVLSPENSLLRDVIATRYATEDGSLIFSTFLNNNNFAIQLESMGATLDNYDKSLETLSTDGYIERSVYIDFRNMISDLKIVSSELADEIISLNNLSQEFSETPDCAKLISYLERFNQSLAITENFSTQWNTFIDGYNVLASGVEVYIATISPSDARILQSSIPSIRSTLDKYYEDEKLFVDTSVGNLDSRFERKEAKEYLDSIVETIQESGSIEAINKYNSAREALNTGNYKDSKRLGREAVVIASEMPPDNGDEPVIIVEEAPDYTIFFIIVGVLLAAILVISFNKKRREAGEEDREDRGVKKEKRAKKGNWSWTKEKESSMEKASKSTL